MNDLGHRYTALAGATNSIALPPPQAVRDHADRRHRIRVALAATAVAVLAGGAALGGQFVFRAQPTPPPPPAATSPSGAAAPTPSPTPPPSAPVRPSATPSRPPSRTPVAPDAIPDRAFLRPGDTNGGDGPHERPSDDMLPPLCGARYPADGLLVTRRTMNTAYWARRAAPAEVPDGTFDETITTYRSDGASRFMRQLRSAVTGCPTQVRDGVTYRHRVLSGRRYGDESLLFELRYPTLDVVGTAGGEDVRLITAVRIGNAVMILYEQGWEAGWSADRGVFDGFTGVAVTRLRAWLG